MALSALLQLRELDHIVWAPIETFESWGWAAFVGMSLKRKLSPLCGEPAMKKNAP